MDIKHRSANRQCEIMRKIYRGFVSAVGVCILAFRRKWQIMQGLYSVESLPSDITTWHRRKGSILELRSKFLSPAPYIQRATPCPPPPIHPFIQHYWVPNCASRQPPPPWSSLSSWEDLQVNGEFTPSDASRAVMGAPGAVGAQKRVLQPDLTESR